MPMLIPLSVLSNQDLGVRLHLGTRHFFFLLICVAPMIISPLVFAPSQALRPFDVWYIIRLSPQLARRLLGGAPCSFSASFFTSFGHADQQDPALSAGSSARHPLISHVLLFCWVMMHVLSENLGF